VSTAHLFNSFIFLGGAKALFQPWVFLASWPFGDVDKDVRYLKDVIDVGLEACAPFLNFVVVLYYL
jgi:hypothetical protein